MERTDHVHHVLEQWRREAPKLDRSPFGVIGRVSRLAVLLQDEIEPIFASYGVTGGEFDVLAALRRVGRPHRRTPTALSNALMVTSGGMTKRLAALERRGLIRRDADPDDARSRAVSLTPAGRGLVDAILPELVEHEERLLDELSGGERADLAGLLEKLAVSLGDSADVRPRRPPRRRRT
jgi:DNA-binding MarR family transcriptional regulator